MKILITGAHFTPALAVIDELRKYPNVKITYVGRETTLEGDNSKSQESQILPNKGIKFIPIIAGRLQRSFTIYTIPSLLKIPIGFLQSFLIIMKEKPDVILSFGGYVGLPVVIAGWLFSIPILIHEQTRVSGLSNQISSLFASKVAVSFNQGKFNSEKIILTGNPLRNEVLNPKITPEYERVFSFAKKEKKPIILVMGGNQGSHTLNKAVEENLNQLTKLACIIHITGDNKYGDFDRLSKVQNESYFVRKWIGKEIGAIYSKISLAICRAGANTLTELAYFGKPGLTVPFEPLYKNEQRENAKYFKDLGLVQILPQSKLSSESFLKQVKIMVADLERLTKQAKGAKKIVQIDSAKRIALEALLLCKK